MKKKIRLLFVIDPWETLDHAQDTTLRISEEARDQGAECWVAENRTISLVGGKPQAEVREISKGSRASPIWKDLSYFHHIFYRVDPPVDLSYLLPLQILARTERESKTKIHPPTSTLFSLNEKWAPVELGKLFPKSLVSAAPVKLLEFLEKTKKAVLKPLYQAQSKGVAVLEAGDKTASERFHQATEGGKIPVILQEYLPEILKGETRLWFTNGKLIASIRKIPKSGESIIDMDRGGTLAVKPLTQAEKAAARAVGAYLKKNKILWAAVDLISGRITDFNHTSPGLLVPMEEVLGVNLARLALKPILSRKN